MFLQEGQNLKHWPKSEGFQKSDEISWLNKFTVISCLKSGWSDINLYRHRIVATWVFLHVHFVLLL